MLDGRSIAVVLEVMVPERDAFLEPLGFLGGPAAQAADLLTRAHVADEVRTLVTGPRSGVERFALPLGRP